MSALEEALNNATAVIPSCEWQIDLLREVLRGTLGTKDQRNALIRIIDQVKQRRPVMPRLEGVMQITPMEKLGSRASYY